MEPRPAQEAIDPRELSFARLAELPFASFDEMQAAVAIKSFNIGVNPLAAAEWANGSGGGAVKTVVGALSVLLIVAAAAAVVIAIVTANYWLILAPAIQGATFYLSQPDSPIRAWVTVGGVGSLLVFINLLMNGWITPAALVAYGGLTFAAVRAASFLTNSAFRNAVLSDEKLFVSSYCGSACTVRNSRTKHVYSR